MDILDQLRQDYQHFPHQQSYQLYADDVYFKDPLTTFRGVERYRTMIGFIAQWFQEVDLQLYSINYTAKDQIQTRWRLSWTAPVPWRPRMTITGWSELKLDANGDICAHVDYWDCSRLSVLGQLVGIGKTGDGKADNHYPDQ